MTYNYQVERFSVFIEQNQEDFLRVRDTVDSLLKRSGAFKMCYAWEGISGDSFTMMAYIDRLVELGEIREITPPDTIGQNRVFVGTK